MAPLPRKIDTHIQHYIVPVISGDLWLQVNDLWYRGKFQVKSHRKPAYLQNSLSEQEVEVHEVSVFYWQRLSGMDRVTLHPRADLGLEIVESALEGH